METVMYSSHELLMHGVYTCTLYISMPNLDVIVLYTDDSSCIAIEMFVMAVVWTSEFCQWLCLMCLVTKCCCIYYAAYRFNSKSNGQFLCTNLCLLTPTKFTCTVTRASLEFEVKDNSSTVGLHGDTEKWWFEHTYKLVWTSHFQCSSAWLTVQTEHRLPHWMLPLYLNIRGDMLLLVIQHEGVLQHDWHLI